MFDLSYEGAWALDQCNVSPISEDSQGRIWWGELGYRGPSIFDKEDFPPLHLPHNQANPQVKLLTVYNPEGSVERKENKNDQRRPFGSLSQKLDQSANTNTTSKININTKSITHTSHINKNKQITIDNGNSLIELNEEKKESGVNISHQNNNDSSDFRQRTLRILSSNARGFYSKRESFTNIIIEEKIDILCISETFSTGDNFPTIKGFTTFFRNRSKRACGGICILVKDEDAAFVTKVASGKDDNEFLLLKFSNTVPELVIGVYYGAQANTFGVAQVKLHISELLESVSKYMDQGCNIQLTGDYKLQIRNEVIPNNYPFMDAS